MKLEKRKREDDGEASQKMGHVPEGEDGVKTAEAPPDEEVEEFFNILRRIHVAVQYFQNRNGGRRGGYRELTATAWNPSFVREDFDGIKKDEEERSTGNQNVGLDLNSNPDSTD